MGIEREDMDALDAVLQGAAREQPDPALMERVVLDAQRVQAGFARGRAQQTNGRQAKGGGWFGAIVEALGGWPTLSGVSAAGVMGLAIGFWAPDMIDAFSAGTLDLWTGAPGWAPDLAELALEAGDV